jgi:hypothetical protein
MDFAKIVDVNIEATWFHNGDPFMTAVMLLRNDPQSREVRFTYRGREARVFRDQTAREARDMHKRSIKSSVTSARIQDFVRVTQSSRAR